LVFPNRSSYRVWQYRMATESPIRIDLVLSRARTVERSPEKAGVGGSIPSLP